MTKSLLLFVCACLFIQHCTAIGCGAFTGKSGKKYNLDALTTTTPAGYNGKETPTDVYTYYYNFCQNIQLAACTGTPTPTAQVSNTGTCISIGFAPPSITERNDANGVVITYTNNVDLCGQPRTIPRVSTFNISCSASTFQLDSQVCQYQFYINAAAACPEGGKPTTTGSSSGGNHGGGGKGGKLSPGSIFLILFFCVLVAYFLVGAAVKWRVYNSAGVELVPNTEFWLGLPGLIRDGFLFVKNKITGAVGYSSL